MSLLSDEEIHLDREAERKAVRRLHAAAIYTGSAEHLADIATHLQALAAACDTLDVWCSFISDVAGGDRYSIDDLIDWHTETGSYSSTLDDIADGSRTVKT